MTGKGVVRNGLIYPQENLSHWEGQEVIYTLPDPEEVTLSEERAAFFRFLQTNSASFGVTDLAENHDYYRRNPPQEG